MGHLAEILRRRSPVVNILSPDQSVEEAVRTMSDRAVGAVLLVEKGSLIGIFSERDFLRRVHAKDRSAKGTHLREVMTRDPITSGPDEDRMTAIRKMETTGCRHLPVVMEGQIVDMVSIRDLLFDEIEERQGEIAELKRYIQGA